MNLDDRMYIHIMIEIHSLTISSTTIFILYTKFQIIIASAEKIFGSL